MSPWDMRLSLSKNPWGSGPQPSGGYNRIWRRVRQIRKKPCVARFLCITPTAAP